MYLRSRVIFSAHRVTDRHGGTENPSTYQPHPPKHIMTNHPFNFLPSAKKEVVEK